MDRATSLTYREVSRIPFVFGGIHCSFPQPAQQAKSSRQTASLNRWMPRPTCPLPVSESGAPSIFAANKRCHSALRAPCHHTRHSRPGTFVQSLDANVFVTRTKIGGKV